MKPTRKEVIIFVVSCLFSFVLGAYLFHPQNALTKTKKANSSASSCTTTNSCNTSPLSLFSQKKLAEAKNAVENAPKANGFCLQIPVLLYHHVQPEQIAQQKGQTSLTVDNAIFDQQMSYLASKGYVTLSAEQLVSALLTHSQLPPNSVVITMDDGYLDNYEYAYPTLQKYHLVGNLMVPTGLMGVNAGANQYYTWDQLKEMVDSGTMFAYDHTFSHFPMASGPADKDTFEATTGQQQLQAHLGKADPIFVYPYGSGQTLGWVQNLLKKNGFVAAFSTLFGRYQCEGNIMALPRIHIGNAPLSSYGL